VSVLGSVLSHSQFVGHLDRYSRVLILPDVCVIGCESSNAAAVYAGQLEISQSNPVVSMGSRV